MSNPKIDANCKLFLPFSKEIAISSGETGIVIARTQIPFRIEHIIFDEQRVNTILIEDIRIESVRRKGEGQDDEVVHAWSLFAGFGVLPGSMFSRFMGSSFPLFPQTMQIDDRLCVVVRNKAACVISLSGGAYGSGLDAFDRVNKSVGTRP